MKKYSLTKNKIDWREEFRKKFTIEETRYELYWKEENPLKILDFISYLLKKQREEMIEKIMDTHYQLDTDVGRYSFINSLQDNK